MNETSFINLERDRWIRLKPALILLRDARSYADRTGEDVWQFATELEELQAQGLTTTDLRWLVSSRTVVHAVENTGLQSPERSFTITNNLSFFERSCFVLSDRGLATMVGDSSESRISSHPTPRTPHLASHSNSHPVSPPNPHHASLSNPQTFNHDKFNINGATQMQNQQPTGLMDRAESSVNNSGSNSDNLRPWSQSNYQGVNGNEVSTEKQKPSWDFSKRELSFDGKTIKQFKWPAANQELLLKSFEEMGWPEKIPDPLPPSESVDSKSRLHDTIKCLNRHLKDAPFRFHGNGNGKGVIWRIA